MLGSVENPDGPSPTMLVTTGHPMKLIGGNSGGHIINMWEFAVIRYGSGH